MSANTFTPGNQDVDVTDFDDGPWPTRTPFQLALHQVAAMAAAKLPETLQSRLQMAVALVNHGHVWPEEDGVTFSVQSQEHPATWYRVNGSCECQDSLRNAPDGLCKHRIGAMMYRRASALMREPAPTPVAILEEAATGEPHADIAAQYIVDIRGKQFVLYSGLLALAHQRGLVSLSAKFISVTPDLALAEATAVFRDGRSFTEAAEATKENCAAAVRGAVPRMALTRAKARVLRDALCVSACSLEELSE